MEETPSAHLFRAALNLPADEREELALTLLDTLASEAELAAIEQGWSDEIERRLAAIDAGLSPGVPWERARGMMFPLVIQREAIQESREAFE